MKIYIYQDKMYCDEDLSEREEELGHEYGGSLFDLLWELDHNNRHVFHESTTTVYYIGDDVFGTDNEYGEEDILNEIIDQGFKDFDCMEVVE